MTLSRPKSISSSFRSLSPAAQPYTRGFTEVPPDLPPLPPNPDPRRVRKLTLAMLLTIVIFVFLTSLILSPLIRQGIAVERQKLEFATAEQQQKIRTQQTMLNQAAYFKGLGGETNYSRCAIQAKQLVAAHPQGVLYAQAQALLRECQDQLGDRWIQQAQAFAQQDRLKEAIALASQIEGAKQAEAQRLIKLWSEQIIKLAERAYQDPDNKLSDALKMAGAIEQGNPLYADSQAKISAWNQEWDNNTAHLEAARLEMAADRLEIARLHLEHMTHHPYWNLQAQKTQQTLNQKQAQYDTLYREAQDALTQRHYQEAIELVSLLPNTDAWANRKRSLSEQSESACRGKTLQSGILTWAAGILSSLLLPLRGRRA